MASSDHRQNENLNGFGYATIENSTVTQSWTYRSGELYHNKTAMAIKEEEIQEFKEKEFKYESDFDRNGIIYGLGSNFGQRSWTNPAEIKLVTLATSKRKQDSTAVSNVIGRFATRCVSEPEEAAWFSIDFGKQLKIKPTAYTLRHYTSWDTEALRNWNLEASNDGNEWIVIKKHENDESLHKRGQAHTWTIEECNQYYRIFRIKRYAVS